MFEAVDADAAGSIADALQTFTDGWIAGYSDYKPEEVPKLESAVLEQNGVYVVFCVSADNTTAKTAVQDLLNRKGGVGLSFASLVFLYFFLPAVLVGYYCFPRRWRNPFLLAANLLFYGWGEPWFLPVILVTAVANWCMGRQMGRCADRKRQRLWLVAALVIDLGLLMVFKYTGFVLETIGLGQLLPGPIPLPLGISFYTFQVVSYMVDIYRNTVPAENNLVCFSTYMTFFPQLIAGPIVRYDELRTQLSDRQETWHKIADGFCLLMIGLGKKMLLANPMGELWEGLRALTGNIGILGAWAGAAAFTLQIYFDFSGYSDMARGLGRMFGFEIPINFRYPYAAQSIQDFWRRWHITLSSWFRDYVYIPLAAAGAAQDGQSSTCLPFGC